MSRSYRVNSKDQNGSMTPEADTATRRLSSGTQMTTDCGWSSRSGTHRVEIGPNTSTPIKSGDQQLEESVNRNMTNDFGTPSFSTAGAVDHLNEAAVGLRSEIGGGEGQVLGAAICPTACSIQHDAPTSAIGVSPGSTRMSFTSEYETGTIAAQRQELQMLIAELKDRDQELNAMVKAHHQQLQSWEEDRNRVHILECRNSQLEASAHRKKDQVRALVARLKTLESVEASNRQGLDKTRAQLFTVTEQLTQSQHNIKETKDKSRNMGKMVTELSVTLSKLESKEREMLSLLKLKDKDLSEASTHMSDLTIKLKALDSKLQASQREEAETRHNVNNWKAEYTEVKNTVDRLKADLNRSQLEEEERRLELDRAKREQEHLRKQMEHMGEFRKQMKRMGACEKRQDELIKSQRLKQERTDAELNSMRQLYEHQQRDLMVLQRNLDNTKELLNKRNENFKADQCNISLLLQSPTSKELGMGGDMASISSYEVRSVDQRTVMYLSPPNTPRLSSSPALTTDSMAFVVEEKSTSRFAKHYPPLDHQLYNNMSAVGTGHHHHPLPVDRSHEDKAGHMVRASSSDQQINRSSSRIPVLSHAKDIRCEAPSQSVTLNGAYCDKRRPQQEHGESNVRRQSRELTVNTDFTSDQSEKALQVLSKQQNQEQEDQNDLLHNQQPYHQSQQPYQQSHQPYQHSQQAVQAVHEHQSLLCKGLQEDLIQQSGAFQYHLQGDYQHMDCSLQAVNEQLKQLQAFSSHIRSNHCLSYNAQAHTQHSLTEDDANSDNRSINGLSLKNNSSENNNHRHQESNDPSFCTPPRGERAPDIEPKHRTSTRRRISLSCQDSSFGSQPASLHVDSLTGDYPEQNGLSTTMDGEESFETWLHHEENSDDQEVRKLTSTAGKANGEQLDHNNSSNMESPTSKLHRLLTESRKMVQSLERKTYPPFFTNEALSPIKKEPNDE